MVRCVVYLDGYLSLRGLGVDSGKLRWGWDFSFDSDVFGIFVPGGVQARCVVVLSMNFARAFSRGLLSPLLLLTRTRCNVLIEIHDMWPEYCERR